MASTRWRLDGQRALVTGASAGIGLAICRELLGLGAQVLMVARDGALLEQARADLEDEFPGPEDAALAFAADVTDEEQRNEILDWAADHGGLHILVNNAGGNVTRPALDYGEDQWRGIFETNLFSAFELWKHTCFEVFLGVPGEPGYREYNFSPSGQWAVYGFRAWRERIEDYVPAAAPEILFSQADDGLVLEARVPAELMPVVPAGSDLQVSLAAVVERKDGTLEYWALRHAAAQADFHARDTFVLTLATATHKAD